MKRSMNQMKIKTTFLEEEEELKVQNASVHLETSGRPVWWFKGSLFKPQTAQERKWAMLQYQSIVREEVVLSERAARIRRFISFLSEWFPVPLLDEIGKDLLTGTALRQTEEDLFLHFLGILENEFRKSHLTIRWNTIFEIEYVTRLSIDKKDINSWMFFTRQRKKETGSDTLRIIQRIVLEEMEKDNLLPSAKREAFKKLLSICQTLRSKGLVCKDPEIAAWSLKRIIFDEKTRQADIPEKLRPSTTRMTFRIRKILKN